MDALRSPAADPDLDRLAELAACLAGDSAVEVLARVLPRRDGEEFPELRDRLVRASLDLPRGPVIVPAEDDERPITTWLRRLPAADRVLLTLRYGERLAPTELARILGQPRARIEARLVALAAAVPQPAEAYLSYGLDRLAEQAPGPGTVRRAVASRQRSQSRRRRRVAGLAVAAALLLITTSSGAGALRTSPLPGGGSHHRVEPPAGWRIVATTQSRNAETTSLTGPPELGVCRITVDAEPGLRTVSRRDVEVRGEAGHLEDGRLSWSTAAGNFAVSCDQPAPAATLSRLADAIRMDGTELRSPIGLSSLPMGFLEPELATDGTGAVRQLTVRRVFFLASLTLPSDPDELTSCVWLDTPLVRSPFDPEPLPVTRTDRLLVEAPDTAVCASLRWVVPEPDQAQRMLALRQLDELAQSVIVASDPADPATWLNAERALPTL